jgi:hypothetical protein
MVAFHSIGCSSMYPATGDPEVNVSTADEREAGFSDLLVRAVMAPAHTDCPHHGPKPGHEWTLVLAP